jgi:hypothetical protein
VREPESGRIQEEEGKEEEKKLTRRKRSVISRPEHQSHRKKRSHRSRSL